MQQKIALLRAINVGGKNLLPMSELVAALESIGAKQVKTYIQSGNSVFESERVDHQAMAQDLSAEIQARRGFAPQVLILSQQAMRDAANKNPFPQAEAEPRSLHLSFLSGSPEGADLAAMQRLKQPSERFALIDSVFYLHAPEGIGRSKLAAATERLLGVSATGRNWATVGKLLAMASHQG